MNPQDKPIHINAPVGSIAQEVILPGDPLRAKYIAENFLENAELVTDVRNMLGYTGTYKGKKVTVMSSGMGIPSAAIYIFELFHFYDVKKIIRVGTCGAVSPDVKLGELIVADSVYSETEFDIGFCGRQEHIVKPSQSLNNAIFDAAKELNQQIHVGTINTTLNFGPYGDSESAYKRIPKELNILGEEMEGYAVCFLAQEMKRDGAVILSVVDSQHTDDYISVEDRQTALNEMIKLSLEAIIKE